MTRRDQRSQYPRKKTSIGTFVFIFVVVAFVIGVALYTYVFNSATIAVVPKYKDVGDIGKVFLFSKDGTDVAGIPFKLESTSLSKSKTLSLSESKKVEAKAEKKPAEKKESKVKEVKPAVKAETKENEVTNNK